MTLTRRNSPPEGLSPEDEQLLRYGPAQAPWPSPATHDRLRVLWAIHGATITASMPRGRPPWFVSRDWFVRQVRREDR
jgi:hypothetical protein